MGPGLVGVITLEDTVLKSAKDEGKAILLSIELRESADRELFSPLFGKCSAERVNFRDL